MKINLTSSSRNRFLGTLIFVLITSLYSFSAFAVKIAIVQYEVQDLNEIGRDADRMENYIREAAAQGAELIICPETSFYRYEPWELDGVSMLDLANHYEDLKNRFSSLASELKISLVIGLREPSGDEEKPVYNTALFIGENGTVLGKQHKFFPSNAEKDWTLAGNSHSVFETTFGRIGLMICKTARTNWWDSYEKADNLDLFILIAGDNDAASFDQFSTICVKANCHGVLANQICGPKEEGRKGNSSWAKPDGSVEVFGGGEKVIYLDLALPVVNVFGPQSGQIMVDPEHPMWLVYNRDEDKNGRLDPYFMCGPGDPEGFLYRGRRNLDGSRDGDQAALIEKVRVNGGNCMYLMVVRTHGGDAWKDAKDDPVHFPDQKHNPWVGQNPAYGLNTEILDQWELWFSEMDRNGITIYLFIYDDAIRVGAQLGWPLDAAGNLHPGEKQFLKDIVNRFEHHRNLVWCVMEEGQEIGEEWQLHISKIAQTIREADDYDHVIANHQLGGNVFFHADDPNIDQFALQSNWETGNTPDSIHQWTVQAWNLSEGRYNLNMAEYLAYDELSSAGGRKNFRQINWACAMAGSYTMVLGMDIISTPAEQLQDCRTLQRFFESTDFNFMAPHDELKFAGTQYVLASPGHSYIAYSSEESEKIGIRDMLPGLYNIRWYDCITGTWIKKDNIKIKAGDNSWKKPAELGEEIALYVCRTDAVAVKPKSAVQDKGNKKEVEVANSAQPNAIPIAPDQRITIKNNAAANIQLTYSDPDGGPGPYTTTIIIYPSYGKLTGVGNDQIYTPLRGYTGNDIITWKVSDGEDDSAVATINLTIEK